MAQMREKLIREYKEMKQNLENQKNCDICHYLLFNCHGQGVISGRQDEW